MYSGKKLKKLRQELDLNQGQFAEALKVSASYYSAVEGGKKPITNKMLSTIQDKWQVKSDWFTSDFTSLDEYKLGANSGGKFGGVNPSHPSNIRNNRREWSESDPLEIQPAYLRKRKAFDRQLAAYISKNPDVQIIDNALNELIAFEYVITVVNEKYTNFILNFADNKGIKGFDDLLKNYYKHIEELRPYKPAIIHLAKAIQRFYKEMYQAGDEYFEFAQES